MQQPVSIIQALWRQGVVDAWSSLTSLFNSTYVLQIQGTAQSLNIRWRICNRCAAWSPNNWNRGCLGLSCLPLDPLPLTGLPGWASVGEDTLRFIATDVPEWGGTQRGGFPSLRRREGNNRGGICKSGTGRRGRMGWVVSYWDVMWNK